MQLRKPLSLLLIAVLLLSTSVVLIPAGNALAGNGPTLESSHDEDDDEMMEGAVTFLVRIENVSGDSDLPTPFAPGVWVLHSEAGPLFTTGEADQGYGLEALAEDGNPAILVDALSGMDLHAGVFNTPAGADGPGPLLPGGAYEFEVKATPDTPYLSFATMFVQSNDLFVGPDEAGIALFDMDGMAMDMMHDVTADLLLWDAGTEENEEPGAGPNQAPRQSAANTGPADGMATVHVVDDGYTYPDVSALVKVTIEPVMMMDDGMDKEMGEKDDMMSDKDDMTAGDAMMGEIMLMEDGDTPYTVVAGDTLGSIARRAYGDSKYWSVICSANSLEDCNLLHVGDELMLPTHAMSMMDEKEGMMGEKDEMMADKDDMDSDKDDSMADKDDMMSDKDDAMADKDDMMSDKDDMMAGDAMMGEIMLMEEGDTPYTVVAGDTLGSIAKRAYGNSKYWSVICSANSLEDCNLIHVGDELMLPTHANAMSMMEEKMMMDEKEGMMGEKDDMMADKDDMESDKDDAMADKDDMESDKDEMMADKDDMKSDKEDMMADKGDMMMDKIELMEDGLTPYTVVAGDTLGSIAARAYGYSRYWGAICLYNTEVTEDCDLIHVGDELSLPSQIDADLFFDEMDAMGPDPDSDEMEKKSDE